MLAAAAEVGIARGNRFPSIALTAKGGAASNSIKGLTSANPWAWDALGSLTLPVFNFGRLRRAEQAAMERYTQSALTYEQTVLTAFSDVEQALVAITTYRRQTERYGELVLANDRIAAMTQALYRSGLSDYLDVIDAASISRRWSSSIWWRSNISTTSISARRWAAGGETNIPTNGDCTSRCKIVSLEPKTKERQCVYPNLRPGNRPRYSK